MISAYLCELESELRVPRRQRARILAEARDHLHEAAASGFERGLSAAEAERDAVDAFGAPAELAAVFHEQLAGASAHRASARVAVLVFAVLAVAALGPQGGFPSALVIWVGGQLAAVAAALALARSLRFRAEGAVPASRLPDLYRANGLGAVAAVIAAAALAPAVHWTLASGAAGAGLLLTALAATRSVASSVARARVVTAAQPPREDALDDLMALAELRLGSRAASSARRAFGWLDVRARPWRFCVAFAAACGAALAAQHGVVDGGELTWRMALASLAIASIEAAAVIACFAAFGRFLGIRR